jgi:hypothetical protein
MTEKNPQYHFSIESIANFRKYLQIIDQIITDKALPKDELLEFMVEIIAIKEHIESLENSYLKNYKI